MNIIQKDVVGFKGIYKISEFGDIVRAINTQNNRWKAGHVLKPHVNHNGYHEIQLFKNKKCKRIFIHRIVAMAFIPNTHNKPFINHKDGNKQNNHISNIEWCTASENQQHAYNILGIKSHNRKLSDNDVVAVRKRYYDGETLSKISKEYSISEGTLHAIVVGKTYKKVSGKLLKKGHKGSYNGRSKLTEKQAKTIKESHKKGNIMYKDIAEDYGVSPTTISRICNGQNWKHL